MSCRTPKEALPATEAHRPPSNLFADTTPPVEHIDIIPGFRVSMADAEYFLRIYISSYSPLFPFVPVSKSISAYDLFVTKPFLLRTIMGIVAPQTHTIQVQTETWFREYIAEHMVVKQEKTLEILQALLLFIAW
jgi:hypothetical protein